ncbi:MAG: hypothetical protein RIT14_2282 [Pseudomonadota bacterium]|jgi:uncharacterized iron-regulated protein
MGPGRIIRGGCVWLILLTGLASAREIGPGDLDRLPQVDVVVLGEVHDNPDHHAHQARAVAVVQPAALVFEMILPEQVRALPSDRGDGVAMARALDWAARGWPDFAMYHPIFSAAPRARIYGADVPQAALVRAMEAGAAAAFGMGAARFGLTEPLPQPEQAARERALWAAHCFALPQEAMAGMVEAQRLRDAALARAVLRAMAETGGPVAVITGTEHARRDRGVPALLVRAAPEVTVLALGQIEGPAEADPPFDLWITTDAPEGRGDPCAAFGSIEG